MCRISKKGVSMFLVIVMIVTFCNSSQVIADTGKNIHYVAEKQLVSLWTVDSVASGSAITEKTTNPETTAEPVTREEKPNTAKVVELKPLETHKIKKKYKTLEEVKKMLSKEMDVSKPSGLSKKDFVKVIRKMYYDYTGVFARNSEYVWDLAHKYRFNEIFFMGIIANESWWGSSKKALATNNFTSMMRSGKLIPYQTERQCLEATARNLGRNYLRKDGKFYRGVTVYAVNKKYCVPGVHKDGSPYKYKWADDVYSCMKMILFREK